MKQNLKILLAISILFGLFTKLDAQEYRLVKSIPTAASAIHADQFDLLYIVEDYKISQYNTNGELLYIYENLEQGIISKLDLSNPLKPVVYYEDFNVVCILDNKLGLINTINLFDFAINQIAAISIPNTMQFWLYDKIDTKLKLYDKNFNLINESESFIQLFEELTEVKSLKIFNNQLYLLDEKGIKVFDQFGTFKTKFRIADLEDFQLFNRQFIFFQDKYLRSIHELTLQENNMFLPKTEAAIQNAVLLKNHLLVQTKSATIIYSIK